MSWGRTLDKPRAVGGILQDVGGILQDVGDRLLVVGVGLGNERLVGGREIQAEHPFESYPFPLRSSGGGWQDPHAGGWGEIQERGLVDSSVTRPSSI